jgi:hypothetical protein
LAQPALGVPVSLHCANPFSFDEMVLAAKGLAALPLSPAFTNCNYPPGSRPFFLLIFWLYGCKDTKYFKRKKAKR